MTPDQLPLHQLTRTRQSLLSAGAEVCSRLTQLIEMPDISDKTRKQLKQELVRQERCMQDLERVLALVQPSTSPRDVRSRAEITGHRTRSVLDRYNIVDEADVRGAGERLEEYAEQCKRQRAARLRRVK
jgi:hypothetical protein